MGWWITLYTYIILVNRDILSLHTHSHTYHVRSHYLHRMVFSSFAARNNISRGPRRPCTATEAVACAQHHGPHRHTALGSRTVAVAAARLYILYTDGHSITSRICSTAVLRTTIEHFCYTRAHIHIIYYTYIRYPRALRPLSASAAVAAAVSASNATAVAVFAMRSACAHGI